MKHLLRRASVLCVILHVKAATSAPPLTRGPNSLTYIIKLIFDVRRINRYSMPVTRSRTGFYDTNLDQTNTTRFLFGDDEPHHLTSGYAPDESFPTLVRRDDQIVSTQSLLLF